MIVQDDQQRPVLLEHPPQRIVSLVPSISETLWHLGVGSSLVGVTRYCIDPVEVRALPRCGGTKNPDCEKIVALQPDLVFMSEEENRREDFDLLVSRGLRVFVSFPRRVDEVADWVRRVGSVVARVDPAESLAREIEVEVRRLAAATAGVDRTRVFCPIWKNPWMSFNADTYVQPMLEVCGADNVFAEAPQRYCEVTLDEASARTPALVLLPDEPYPFSARHLVDVEPLIQPRGPAHAARVVDGRALSWYGARTPAGLRAIRQSILGGHARSMLRRSSAYSVS